jgi:dienelactone hydrolase
MAAMSIHGIVKDCWAAWRNLSARIFGLAVLALGLSACASGTPGGGADVQRTWREALVVLPQAAGGEAPGSFLQSSGAVARHLRKFPLGTRFPTVVFLHGCTGIGNLPFLEELARQGYAVVAPDSFARRYRPLQCDPETSRGGRNLFVYDFRSAELTYALERLPDLTWVDLDNLFLIGASEGGVTAALFRGDVFNARVIAQWTCTGAPLVAGIGAPRRTPILAIVRDDDPYYAPANTPGQQGHCGLHMTDRVKSQSLVVHAGAGDTAHDVLGDTGAVAAILEFLSENRGLNR